MLSRGAHCVDFVCPRETKHAKLGYPLVPKTNVETIRTSTPAQKLGIFTVTLTCLYPKLDHDSFYLFGNQMRTEIHLVGLKVSYDTRCVV